MARRHEMIRVESRFLPKRKSKCFITPVERQCLLSNKQLDLQKACRDDYIRNLVINEYNVTPSNQIDQILRLSLVARLHTREA